MRMSGRMSGVTKLGRMRIARIRGAAKVEEISKKMQRGYDDGGAKEKKERNTEAKVVG